MNQLPISAVGVLLVVALASGSGPDVSARETDMTFVVTSVGKGNGADLGGLKGADGHCLELARTADRRTPTGVPT